MLFFLVKQAPYWLNFFLDITQLLTSLVGIQTSKVGALGNPIRRKNDKVVISVGDNWFFSGIT